MTKLIENHKLVFWAVVVATILSVWLIISAVASNMGFKLNLSNIKAINNLLSGSGMSLAVTDNNSPPKSIGINIDPLQNSNMGFKIVVPYTSKSYNGVQVQVGEVQGILYQGTVLQNVVAVVEVGDSVFYISSFFDVFTGYPASSFFDVFINSFFDVFTELSNNDVTFTRGGTYPYNGLAVPSIIVEGNKNLNVTVTPSMVSQVLGMMLSAQSARIDGIIAGNL